jgi:hypothetical protein
LVLVAGVVVMPVAGEAGELKLEPAGDGKPVFVKSAEIAGLSGVTWCGGDAFAAVSDREPVVVPLTLKIGPNGVLEKAAAGVPVRLATRLSDCEGIAWVAGEGRFYVSAEGGPGIQGFGRADGKAGPELRLPEVFGQARANLCRLPIIEMRRLLIEHFFEIPDHRIGIEIRPIMEFHARTQLENPALAVGWIGLP